jgi:hypothetical protein
VVLERTAPQTLAAGSERADGSDWSAGLNQAVMAAQNVLT